MNCCTDDAKVVQDEYEDGHQINRHDIGRYHKPDGEIQHSGLMNETCGGTI